MAMARSKLDEHKLRDAPLEDLRPGDELEVGPFKLELVHMTHSIPDSCAVALRTELGTVVITGDYKFDQTPVDGLPADVSGWPSSAATECCCCAGTRPTPTGPDSRRPSAASDRTSRRCSRGPRGGSS